MFFPFLASLYFQWFFHFLLSFEVFASYLYMLFSLFPFRFFSFLPFFPSSPFPMFLDSSLLVCDMIVFLFLFKICSLLMFFFLLILWLVFFVVVLLFFFLPLLSLSWVTWLLSSCVWHDFFLFLFKLLFINVLFILLILWLEFFVVVFFLVLMFLYFYIVLVMYIVFGFCNVYF